MKFFHHIICVTSALQHSSTLSARCIKRNPVAASACCSDFVSSCFIAGHHSIRFRLQQLSLPFCIVCSSCPEQDTSIVQIATWRSFPTLVIPRSEWRPPVKLPFLGLHSVIMQIVRNFASSNPRSETAWAQARPREHQLAGTSSSPASSAQFASRGLCAKQCRPSLPVLENSVGCVGHGGVRRSATPISKRTTC